MRFDVVTHTFTILLAKQLSAKATPPVHFREMKVTFTTCNLHGDNIRNKPPSLEFVPIILQKAIE